MYGMIKLGSRTELVVPRDESLKIETKIGDKVSAGSTVMARYEME
jgi:phosphatidylserine decarboxylase